MSRRQAGDGAASAWSIEAVDHRSDAIARQIERHLLQALARQNRQATNERATFAARDVDGRLIGGATVATAYGWLQVKTLWVDEAHRRHGIGRALLQAAIVFGTERACHGCWLDTSSVEGGAFYRSLGFEPFAELANGQGQFPDEHRRWFLQRPLLQSGDGTTEA